MSPERDDAVPEQAPKFSRGRQSFSAADDSAPVDVAHFEHAVGMLLDRVDQLQASQTDAIAQAIRPVSYTHLTLPTNREV